MDQNQARSFIKSNGHPKLWGYDPEGGKWTFSIRPWLSIRLDPATVKPADPVMTEGWPEMRNEAGSALVWEEAAYGFFERETKIMEGWFLRLPGVVVIPKPLPGGSEVSVMDYQFARCMERTEVAGDHLLDRTLRYLGLELAAPVETNTVD